MNVLATIRGLLPIKFDAAHIRKENCRKVNERAAKALLDAEREYWMNYVRQSNTEDEYFHGTKQLAELDKLEANRG